MGKKKLKKRVSELEYTLAWLVRKMESQDNATNDPQKPYVSTHPEKCHSVTEHEIPDLQAKISEIIKEIRQLKSVDEHHFDMAYRGYKRSGYFSNFTAWKAMTLTRSPASPSWH